MTTPKLTRFARTCDHPDAGVILVHTHLLCAHFMGAYIPTTTDLYVLGTDHVNKQLDRAPSIYLYNHGPSIQDPRISGFRDTVV